MNALLCLHKHYSYLSHVDTWLCRDEKRSWGFAAPYKDFQSVFLFTSPPTPLSKCLLLSTTECSSWLHSLKVFCICWSAKSIITNQSIALHTHMFFSCFISLPLLSLSLQVLLKIIIFFIYWNFNVFLE